MIYTASLNIPVKKALKNQVMQSSVSKIVSLLTLDPETTNMDVVFFGPKDLLGPRQSLIQNAVANKHPDVCVIYIYVKDNEADLLDTEYKLKTKKISEKAIVQAFEEFVGDHQIRAGKQQVASADFTSPIDEEEFFEEDPIVKPVMPTPQVVNPDPEPVFDDTEIDIPEFNMDIPPEEEFKMEPTPMDTAVGTHDVLQSPLVEDAPIMNCLEPDTNRRTIEQQLAGINSFEDWALFKEQLNKNSVVKHLIEENSEYVGLVQMLDVLDKRIEAVWRDSSLSPDMKFDRIKEIGLERSVVRASTNSINVDKVISIISTIVLSAKRTVDAKLASLDTAMYKITTDKEVIADTSYIDKAITERTKIQLELLNISRGIVDLYKSIDVLVTDEIAELDRKLPSANAFINDMVKPIGTQIFTPQNTAALTNKLLKALQENRLIASQLEESVNNVIEMLFELCDKDEEIIRYQSNLINMLKAHRVEDVIITNTLIKQCLQLYVGADNTGRSATAITWCGILSRRHNSLLIDLTGRAKFREYGITPMRLDDFMTSRPEQQFLCVESDHILEPEEIQKLVDQIKSRLNYYPYVNIILAPEDTNGLTQLSEDAKVVHYITDCSTQSIRVMKDVVDKHKYTNIARKLITIDTPVSPLMIAESMGVDATKVKLVTLPTVPAVRACAIRHDRPYEYTDTIKIFEEAFR